MASAFAAGMSPGARELAITERVGAGTISRKDPAAPAPAAAAPIQIKSTTTATPASGGTDRWTVGVGEEVKFEAVGGETGDWTATGGTPATANGPSLTWLAPGTAGQYTIKLKTDKGEATKSVAVVTPTGVKFTVHGTRGPLRDDMMGLELELDMQLEPLNVSFNKVKIREVPGGAHGLTGYFSKVKVDLKHEPESRETSVRDDNKTGAYDYAKLMDVTDEPWPKPLAVGQMVWDIPYKWWTTDSGEQNLSIVKQTMGIVDSKGTVTIGKGTASGSRTPTPAADERRPAGNAGGGRTGGQHVAKLGGDHGGKLKGDGAGGAGSGAAATIKAWNVDIAGIALDLADRLANPEENTADGTKTIQIGKSAGPLKVNSAKFKPNAAGDKVESGTLYVEIESGPLKGSTGELKVTSAGKASGKIAVQIDAAKFLKKKVEIEIGDGKIVGTATIAPGELMPPDFPIKTSHLEITVEYTQGKGIEVTLKGTASVTVENGFAKGAATLEVQEFKFGSSGISFKVKVSGKIDIAGLADAEAAMTYDGEKLEFLGGSSNIKVALPGIEGTALIEFGAGKLSLDSKDLHFTLPKLDKVKFESVHLEKKNLAAKLSLNETVSFPLPGGASIELSDSSIEIDGKKVDGKLTGSFKMPGADGFGATATVNYKTGGGFGGSIKIDGGADLKFGGVEVGIKAGSKLTVQKDDTGLAVEGDVTGTVKIPALQGAKIEAHIIAKKGEPIDLEVDASVPLSKVYSKLGGELNVKYKRGGGAASKFEFKATDISYAEKPINGQVLFSEFSGKVQGNEITGSLTAASGTVIKAGSASVTINSGNIKLLPGKKLEGDLDASAMAAGAAVEAKVGWKDGKFTWSAEAVFDLGTMTYQKVLGKARVAGGSDGSGRFISEGPITFASPALAGVTIDSISGDKEVPRFDMEVSAEGAVNKVLEKVPSVGVTLDKAKAKITYADRKLKVNGAIEGAAKYPKEGAPKLSGRFALSMDDDGFTGKLSKLDLKVSDYFTSNDGSADLKTGDVSLPGLAFTVPGFATGTATADINVKTGKFDVKADAKLTGALTGVELSVAVKNDSLDAKLKENAPPISIGKFAKLTIGAGSNVHLGKGKDLTAHVAGAVDAPGLGNGTFALDYKKGEGISGSADIHVLPFAMFNGVDIHMTVDKDRNFSTGDILLSLAPAYSTYFDAAAKVKVTRNELLVTGEVSKLKGLGKVSEAFKGAKIKWDQAAKQVTMDATLDMGEPVIPELSKGSTLEFKYDGKVISIDGTLKPKSIGTTVKFDESSAIKAHWDSATKKFTVTGGAKADIAELATAEFTVDANAGGGEPASFYLKGKIQAETLANKLAKGAVTFGEVTADFGLRVGGAAKSEFDFHVRAGITAIPVAGITDIAAHIDVNYKSGHGVDGELAVTRAKIGDVEADGKISVVKNKFSSGSLHMKAAFPALTVEGTGTITAGEMGELNTAADLTVTPGGTSVLSKFITSGSLHVDLKKWKLTNVVGKLNIKPPDILPIDNTFIEVAYQPEAGISAKLHAEFNAPMGKGEKGTFDVGYTRDRGLYASIMMPMYFPGFNRAEVRGDLDKTGLKASVDLYPKDAKIIKKAHIGLGYDIVGGNGLFAEGSLTLAPTESLEFVVGVKYSQKGGLEVLGIDSKDKDEKGEEHEVAAWKKPFPTIPLLTVGVASLGLKFTIGVGAGYRMPKIKFESPKLEGGLEALDSGGMPAFTFGGSIAMGAYVALSLSVQVVGEIQLLIATCSAGIGAEIMARLNLEMGADIKGRFAPGQGATLEIDPFVGASLDLIASLIATLYAEVCWFTLVDKKWTLASMTFAHIELGKFKPFKPIGMQFGGPGGTKLTQGLALREDGFEGIIDGVKEGGKKTADEESNKDAREKVTPVLQAFKNAAPQFAELPPGWENGLTVAPVDFSSMFPVGAKEWDYYQDNADTAETVAPAMAMNSPTERLAKAVAILAKRNPFGAGQLVLAWRRAQIAAKGINPDTGVDVVAEREIVQAEIIEKYNADLLKANEDQKKQDDAHAAHVAKQGKDFGKAQGDATKEVAKQKAQHEKEVTKTKTAFTETQDKKSEAAKVAATEGAPVQPAKAEKAPPPPTPPPPAPPKPLAKPAVIPTPPPVPLPAPAETLPAVTLPALPSDPGSLPRASMTIAPQKKQVEPQSPGVKEAPKGGAPDPKPGAAQNSAAQTAGAGGGGGGPAKGGGGGAPAAGGGGGGGGAPAPAVKAGVEGIVSQQKTLDAKEAAVVGPGKGKGTGGKATAPGGVAAAPPAPAAAAAGKAPGAPGPGADAKNAGAKAKQPADAMDPTVKAVADKGKTEQKAFDQKLDAQSQQYDKNIKTQNQAAQQDTKKLEEEAAAAKKKKEDDKKNAAAGGGAAAPPASGATPAGAPGEKKPAGPIGTKIALDILGKSETLYIDDKGTAMVSAGPSPVDSKLNELSTSVNAAPDAIKEHGAKSASTAQAAATKLSSDAKKAAGGDENAKTAAGASQQALAEPLKITWKWAEVSKDPAVTGGSIDDPLKHPYYVTFKGRVATLNDKGQITVEVSTFAEQIWSKICKAVKDASPAMNDPAAYSNFAKGWLDMKSAPFQNAVKEFDKIGVELAKAGKSGFATAKNFGFWSKEEGRSLAEAVSDLTLETSSVGGLMDGLPTLDAKKAGWDPEIWGALSQAYANAVVPELLKGKKVNVCVGAGVPAGNIWDAVESAALEKGLKGTKLTLESVTTTFGAAAKATNNRKSLDETKNVGGKKGCVFTGDRAGAIAAANAHYSALEAKEKAAGGPAPVPPPPPTPSPAPPPAPGAATAPPPPPPQAAAPASATPA
ncbi:MAG: hypothetical protein H0T46_15750, partial [Deltaproteobacteria bacterium]|nr:hypothetical protein [Deltaproteobacteria bacterium]